MTLTITIVVLVVAYYGYNFWQGKQLQKETQEMYNQLSSEYNNAFSQGDISQIQRTAKNLIHFHAVSQNALNTVYEQCLSLLKIYPDLKPFVLEVGRRKYAHFRENGSPTVYDESAIMNDINAAL